MRNSLSSSAEPGSKSANESVPTRNSKRAKYSRFTQQELPAWKPILTPKWAIFALALVGVIFVTIGTVSLVSSTNVVEIADRYDVDCIPRNMRNNKVTYIQDDAINKTCTRTLTVPKDMDQPINVYYQLDNFYQNHMRYVKSRNDEQLMNPKQFDITTGCAPERTTMDGSPIVPCGLIAWSLFNDTYTFAIDNKNLNVNKKNISWNSDRNNKFGKNVFPKNFQNGTLIGGARLDPNKPLSEQEDLIVWMRAAAFPTFRKLYGRIEQDVKANDIIKVTVQNNYNTYSFNGNKKLVLSTSSWLGGKNDFIGIAFLIIGGLCLLLATAFTVVYLVKPRKLGDLSYLTWNRNPSGH